MTLAQAWRKPIDQMTPEEARDALRALETGGPESFAARVGADAKMSVYGLHEAGHPLIVRQVLSEAAGTAAADVIVALAREINILHNRCGQLRRQAAEAEAALAERADA